MLVVALPFPAPFSFLLFRILHRIKYTHFPPIHTHFKLTHTQRAKGQVMASKKSLPLFSLLLFAFVAGALCRIHKVEESAISRFNFAIFAVFFQNACGSILKIWGKFSKY